KLFRTHTGKSEWDEENDNVLFSLQVTQLKVLHLTGLQREVWCFLSNLNTHMSSSVDIMSSSTDTTTSSAATSSSFSARSARLTTRSSGPVFSNRTPWVFLPITRS